MTIKDIQRLVEIEKAIVLSEQDRQFMRQEFKELKEDVKNFDNKLDLLIDKLENKFAPKRTEKALIRVITAMCGGVVTWIVKLVIK